MLIFFKILGSLVRFTFPCLVLSSAGRSGASWLHTSSDRSPGEWAGNLERLFTAPVGDGSLRPWSGGWGKGAEQRSGWRKGVRKAVFLRECLRKPDSPRRKTLQFKR